MSRNRTTDADWARRTVGTCGLAASTRLGPDMCRYAASPRIRVVGAPVCHALDSSPSIGATENFPRVEGPVVVLAGTHAADASSSGAEDISAKAVWESRGVLVTFGGRHAGNAAPGRCWRNGFVHSRHAEIETGDPEEGVPCSWTTVGIGRKHDDDVPLAPGAPLRRIPESSRIRGGTASVLCRSCVSDD
jgi:hypothetical protein